jgi:hypothetical protein
MKDVSIVMMSAVLAGMVGVAYAEDRKPDHEPLEHKYRRAPMTELHTDPARGGRLSDRDESADSKAEDPPSRHDKSDARGGRSSKDDDDDD